MGSSVPNIAAPRAVHGPDSAFTLGPDDATRCMLRRWHSNYGDVYRVRCARDGALHWVIHDPELVRQVLVTHSANYAKGPGLDRVRLLLGDGIMVSEGDFWARQRRLMQPAFRPAKLADFNAMIVAENQARVARWAAAADAGRALDAVGQTSELTLAIVLKSIFGGDYEQLVAAGDNPFALLAEDSARDLRFAARFHRLGQVVETVIEQRLDRPRPGFDFLGHMLAARSATGETMSRRALVDEVMTLVVAGHETTASALAWAWVLIATHPPVCRRLQAAVDALDVERLGAGGGHRDPALAYLDAVISETLRLYPPGWLLSRRARAADRLGGHPIEAGSALVISPYVLHRHARYWHAPEVFDPARFLGGDQPRHRFAYIPFAAGPRHCIGEHLAMVEMRVHLALALRAFTPRYAGAHAPEIESRINLRPAGPIFLQLQPR